MLPITVLLLLAALGAPAAGNPHLQFLGRPELVAPGVVCTEASEIKAALSPDGTWLLWGTIGWEGGAGGWDLWQSRRVEDQWQKPQPVPFNSADNDFDPAFSPDGAAVYFFSNRPGGLGGDDLYVVPLDPATGRFGEPRNLGERINTPRDEWGPTLSPDGARLMYCTDGLDGLGGHDLFICRWEDDGWGAPAAVAALNSDADDFDPTFLHDGTTIVFSRRTGQEDEVLLYASFVRDGQYTPPAPLPDGVNTPGTWNFGAAIGLAEPGLLYFTSHIPGHAVGRADLYRVGYRLAE